MSNPPPKTDGRIAIFSDVHACLEALQAVLASISARGISRILFLGDILGYGPDPAECLRLLRAGAQVCLLGNHDAMAADAGFDLSRLSAPVAIPLDLARKQLDAGEMLWLEERPLTWNAEGLEASHAGLHNPGLFIHLETPEQVRRHFSRQTAAISFFGHTHVPVVYGVDERDRLRMAPGEEGEILLGAPGRYAVGVGSVGFSRDDDPRACWVEFLPDAPGVIFHRVEFDAGAAARRTAAMLAGPAGVAGCD